MTCQPSAALFAPVCYLLSPVHFPQSSTRPVGHFVTACIHSAAGPLPLLLDILPGRTSIRLSMKVHAETSRKRTPELVLDGRPGNWVAVDGRTNKVVAEARTLMAVARKARRLGLKDPTFAVVPRRDCALIL